MKSKLKKVSFILVGVLLLLCGCSTEKILLPDYDIGVVFTKPHQQSSMIKYYSLEGELIKTKKLELAWLDTGFGSFGENDTHIYIKVDHENGTIFELNKATGEYQLYDLSYNALSISAEEEEIYFSNSNKEYSTISRFTPTTQELTETTLKRTIVSTVYPYKECLYVFGVSPENTQAYLYILDKSTLEVIDIQVIPTNAEIFRAYGIDDIIYFTNNYKLDTNQGANSLSTYNIKTKIFQEYTLEADSPYDILHYKDSLIITHLDPTSRMGNIITLFNLETKVSETIEIENIPIDSALKEDVFISCDMEKVYIYSLPDFKLIDTISISDKSHYMSTLFTK